ncbi:hypothetical protein HJFPF1_04091 [Paramyrothecium foliicola]|nr:hypothetical protein HJFPF1_04091 [Paramyrothecium foliicola]
MTMPFPLFQALYPSLLPIQESASPDHPPVHREQSELAQSLSDVGILYGPRWRMIASSSSMWQDRKYAIDTVYAPVGANTVDFSSEATWFGENSTKQSYTKGINHARATKTGYAYDWRGTGWLRLITTHWEILGLGIIPHRHREPEAEVAGSKGTVDGNGTVVLVTFVQKTFFSPQALSVMVQEAQLENLREEDLLEDVSAALKGLGVHSLSAEVDVLKILPRKSGTISVAD